jgi:hypothetical protein
MKNKKTFFVSQENKIFGSENPNLLMGELIGEHNHFDIIYRMSMVSFYSLAKERPMLIETDIYARNIGIQTFIPMINLFILIRDCLKFQQIIMTRNFGLRNLFI